MIGQEKIDKENNSYSDRGTSQLLFRPAIVTIMSSTDVDII